MQEIVFFFRKFESLIYWLLGLGVLRYAISFWLAWQSMQKSLFGLERINAQRRLNQSAISIFLMVVMGFVVFSMVTFVGPVVSPGIGKSTNPMVSDGDGIIVTPAQFTAPAPEVVNPNELLPTATNLPTVSIGVEGCVPEVLQITFPQPGQEISGAITVEGIVNVQDFGFYIFSVAPQSAALWLPIEANREPVLEEGVLVENWDVSSYSPGDYVIQLLVTESSGAEMTPCQIPIRISSPP